MSIDKAMFTKDFSGEMLSVITFSCTKIVRTDG